jgi:hypothetical protein
MFRMDVGTRLRHYINVPIAYVVIRLRSTTNIFIVKIIEQVCGVGTRYNALDKIF